MAQKQMTDFSMMYKTRQIPVSTQIPTPIHTARLAVAVLALFAFAAPLSAQAGFEWTPPAARTVPAVDSRADMLMPEMPAMSRDAVEMMEVPATSGAIVTETISGYVETGVVDAPRFSPRLSRQMDGQMDDPVNDGAWVSPQPAAVPSPSAPAPFASASVYEEAIGFGSDIPLAMAMRQIVPPHYAYDFSAAVDQGTRIDWNGGKPWDEVLRDALRPHHLDIAVSDRIIHVFAAGQNPYIAQAAPAPQKTVSAPANIRQTTPASKPVQEVYVRRHSAGNPVAAADAPLVLTAKDAGKSRQDPSLWSRLGIGGTSSNVDQAPRPPQEETGLVARIHEAQIEEAGIYQTEFHAAQRYEAEIDAPVPLTTIPVERQSQAGNIYMVDVWQAGQGESLRRVLQAWSDKAGVELRWAAPSDYALSAPIRLQGSYTDALSKVLGDYDDSAKRPVGRLHPNLPAGPSVLLIEDSVNG